MNLSKSVDLSASENSDNYYRILAMNEICDVIIKSPKYHNFDTLEFLFKDENNKTYKFTFEDVRSIKLHNKLIIDIEQIKNDIINEKLKFLMPFKIVALLVGSYIWKILYSLYTCSMW